ncbi:Shedu anti-phage system protein SduA domain-containing protein [Fimbriiglobus ruber]|uniref:Shedu protein SduA C-terminal domain-containing protein n=1 Tax=Fimbriiglobus ruber TaxID=1908690 RepID=A0A225E047_9BACT|nr:Shedu anti-phage system protein SduA domain-containing protein [Fimbriiglobus ruber]OWK46912.1 hypothetical protein FRUB_00611 [Fimbriiglobus ruber]
MAQQFTAVKLNPKQCRIETDEFGDLLRTKAELSEKYDIQPFFKSRVQVSAFVGSFMLNIGPATHICFEYNFFGDYAADLVLGDKAHRRFCVVEFEDGRLQSIFRPSPSGNSRVWSPRFEHGFSQIIDWYTMLDDLKKTERFKRDFGDGHIRFSAMLIIGRDTGITDPHDQFRLDWRADKVSVDSNNVICVTFDELYRHMDRHLRLNTGY